MSSDISEKSKLDECAAGAVSSASNIYVDDVYENSSPLIVDLSKTVENKAFIEHENEELMSGVRIRKPTEKVKKVSDDHACRNTRENIVASRKLL